MLGGALHSPTLQAAPFRFRALVLNTSLLGGPYSSETKKETEQVTMSIFPPALPHPTSTLHTHAHTRTGRLTLLAEPLLGSSPGTGMQRCLLPHPLKDKAP